MTYTLFDPPLHPAECVLSPCGRYRYWLRLHLSYAGTNVMFCMANPSKAVVDAGVFTSDPTVSRCINYARSWGFGSIIVTNVRAWRETDPKLVPPDPKAIGPDNNMWIHRGAIASDLVVAGWGKLGGARGDECLRIIRYAHKTPHALKLNSDGSPAHPLYLSKSLKPRPIEEHGGLGQITYKF